MPKKKFIVLPTIKSFEILNYPMFNQDWKYTVRAGLNLMLGVNEIGKTTTVNILSYAMVGSHKGLHEENINPEYFLSRIIDHEAFLKDERNNPRIEVDVIIGEHAITVCRSLREDRVLSLTIDKKKIPNHDELSEQYIEIIKEFTGLSSFDDLSFLLSYLLVREEEGNYLLWDEDRQSRVIRLLLNTKGFADEYKELEEQLQKADSEYKREKDFMGRYEKRREGLMADRDRQLATNKEFVNKEDLKSLLNKLKVERQEAIQHKDTLLLRSAQIQVQVAKAQGESTSLRSAYEFNAEELKILEAKFYKSSFQDPKTELVFSKIDHRHICIVCNSNVPARKVSEVVKKVKKQHECPVCDSPLNRQEETTKPLSERDIKRMESLEELIKQGQNEIRKAEHLIEKLLSEKDTLNQKIFDSEERIRQVNLSIALNQTKLDEVLKKSETPITSFDFSIDALDKEIEVYREKTVPLYKAYQRMVKKMEEKNNELNRAIGKFNERLVEIFLGMSKLYFGDNCSLVLHYRKPKGFELQLAHFIPELEGKERVYQTRVSKSQAIFLEYLFRLSLLKLYSEISGIKPFLFLETSEGSFDVTNTELMAKTLTQMSSMGFAFVIITNLSKVDFIEKLLPEKEERRKRTFNLLTYAHSSIQKKKAGDALRTALKQLNLN